MIERNHCGWVSKINSGPVAAGGQDRTHSSSLRITRVKIETVLIQAKKPFLKLKRTSTLEPKRRIIAKVNERRRVPRTYLGGSPCQRAKLIKLQSRVGKTGLGFRVAMALMAQTG